jgi:hypothetical protein
MFAANSWKNPALIAILSLLVVLGSGCTGIFPDGGGAVSGSGIVIQKFEPTLTSLRSNDNVVFHLEVQNMGDVIGKAAAVLIGITPTEWQIDEWEKDFGELLPADEEAGTPGGTGVADWYAVAPDVYRGEDRSYNVIARMFYSYETRVRKPITFLTSDELRRAAQMGGTPVAGATLVSAGPLSVTVNTGNYVRATGNEYEAPYFPVNIKITNNGPGQIAGENYPVGVEIIPPEGTSIMGECPSYAQTEMWSPLYANLPYGLDLPASPSIVNIWNGREVSITCRLQVDEPPLYKDERDLRIILDYIYFQDAELVMPVRGTTEVGW